MYEWRIIKTGLGAGTTMHYAHSIIHKNMQHSFFFHAEPSTEASVEE
jgi:hypothetical protein